MEIVNFRGFVGALYVSGPGRYFLGGFSENHRILHRTEGSIQSESARDLVDSLQHIVTMTRWVQTLRLPESAHGS